MNIKLTLLIALSFFLYWQADAQCVINVTGVPCVGNPIEFEAVAPGASNFSWNFNNEGFNNTNSKPVFTFTSTGVKNITLSCKLSNGTICNSSVSVTIKALPKVRMSLLSNPAQCFENNMFCIRDSSLSGDNDGCIKSIKYLFSDGELITKYGSKNNPVALPSTICKSYQDPQGGSYNLTVEIEDCNGCIIKDTLPFLMKVELLPSIFAVSNLISDRCKGNATVKFYNQSQIKLSDVTKFRWDFGDGTSDSTSWDSTSHQYDIGNKLTDIFSPTLTIWTGIGCKRVFSLADVIIYNLVPKLIADKDSICVNEIINFEIQPDALKQFITDEKIRWNFDPGVNYGYKTFNVFGNLGPHLITATLSHVCGPYVLRDTINVIGPLARIEPDFLNPLERYQCKSIDSIHVTDHSLYYHNDDDMLDEDSMYDKTPGNFKFVMRFNPQTGRVEPYYPYNYDRDKDHVDRLWDFGDAYCLPCTTDREANLNIGMNCRYSKDTFEVHKYNDWDSIYRYLYVKSPVLQAYFDRTQARCGTRRIWFTDTMYAVVDTFLYYGNNPLGISVRDSNVFQYFSSKVQIPAGLFGIGGFDFPYDLKVYVPKGNSISLVPKSGGTLTVNGPQYYTVSPNYRITTGAGDTCYFIFGTRIYKDTLFKEDVRPRHKLVNKFVNPAIAPGDSIDPVLHRRLYYLQVPRCNKITLRLRDTVHPFKCESVASTNVALLPPSAKKLKIDDHFCYGYGNKVIEFSLEDTKPGCMASTVWFNPDFVNKPNDWKLLNDMYSGDIPRQSFFISKPPYAGYSKEGPNINTFYWVYNDTILPNRSVQDINVGLIIGNGIAPSECFDTVYFSNFATFPRLVADLEFVNTHAKKDHVCRNELAYVTIPRAWPDANKLADFSAWFMVNDGTADTVSKVEEYYYKVVDHQAYPGKKVNYTVFKRYELGTGGLLTLKKTDTLVTAIVHSYKPVMLPGGGYKTLREKVSALGIDLDDVPDSVVLELIWNGVGTIGMPSTGSKGCVDTSGFGTELDWYFDITSSTVLHYKDSSLLPVDSVSTPNGYVKAYGFLPRVNGSYTIIRSVESYFPTWCPIEKMVSLAVGFDAKVEFADTIICVGRLLQATPQFRYFDNDDPLNLTYDTIDYWLDRANEAGKKNREGFTIWDLSKEDDDINNPATIFGNFPYAVKGYGTPNILIGNQPGAIYYKTPGVYTQRVMATDSNGCSDTFTQKLYITGPMAGFYTDIATPNCKTILELFDTSKIIDPCEQNGMPPCDFIYKWTIDWGDGSPNLEYLNQLPKQIGHDYGQNGYFEITIIIESVLGCKDTMKRVVFIPGPSPLFVPETSLYICVNDSVTFRNLTQNATSSSQWLWNFGDGFYSPQTDTGLMTHKYTQTGKFDVYLNQYDSIANTGKYCPGIYPNVDGGMRKITVTVLPYDTVKLNAVPIVVCVGDTITITADLKSQNTYTKYNWEFGVTNFQTTDLVLKVAPHKKGAFQVTWSPDTIGLNSSFCPDYDTITVYADSIYADFIISKSDAPFYCFTNRSTWAVKYRWGFYHDTDITRRKLEFKENKEQFPPDSIICNNFIDHFGVNWVCLEATNALGCKDTACRKIDNDYEMAIQPPNVFTPNADGFTGKDKEGLEGNEVFNIYTKNVEIYHLVIYDRWGVKVFESDDQKYDWNGRYMNDGYNCPDGTYYYILDYRYKGRDKNEPVINGVVRIIR